MSGKRKAVKTTAAERQRKAWAEAWLENGGGCMVCGTQTTDFRGYSVHHLLPGRCGRSDEPCNWLVCCASCHDDLENRSKLPLSVALTVKLVRDWPSWDSHRLAALHGKRLPELQPIPKWIEERYLANMPTPFRPWRYDHLSSLALVNEWIRTYEIVR